jgi:triacylglycerol lipase
MALEFSRRVRYGVNMSRHHVVLVPGFFGFGSLGELTYFVGVREALERAFDRFSLDVNVIEVPTLPTASIRHRAARVHETLAQVALAEDGPIHIVGHSTGGLDARLAITPTSSLPTTLKFRDHERLRTLVTISTPHFGTPLASFFGSAAGYPLMRLCSALIVSVLKHGYLPVGFGLRIGGWFVRADDAIGFKRTALDDFFDSVIADFSPERRAELIAFIEGVSQDQSLIFQLTAAGCDLLNASTADPSTLRYGSVVCRARPPRLSNLLAFKHDPYTQMMHALYAALYKIAGFNTKDRFPEPVPEQRVVLERAFGAYPEGSWSDGIVPTLSQIWGEVIHAANADHLDVVGHYGSMRPEAPTTDWLPTRSGFDDAAFETLWGTVARFITDDARTGAAPGHRENVGVERTQVELKRARGAAPTRDVVTANDRAREVLDDLPEPKDGPRSAAASAAAVGNEAAASLESKLTVSPEAEVASPVDGRAGTAPSGGLEGKVASAAEKLAEKLPLTPRDAAPVRVAPALPSQRLPVKRVNNRSN